MLGSKFSPHERKPMNLPRFYAVAQVESTFLRLEVCSNNLADFSLKKARSKPLATKPTRRSSNAA